MVVSLLQSGLNNSFSSVKHLPMKNSLHPCALPVILLFAIQFVISQNISAQLLQQDFSLNNPISQYVSATPTNQQFTAISTSGAGASVSAATGSLVYTRTGATGTYSRIDDFSPTPATLSYSFKLAVTCAANSNSVAQIRIRFQM